MMNKDIPPEIFLTIGTLLEPVDLIRCSLVCRSWRSVYVDQLWGNIDDGIEPWHSLLRDPIVQCDKAPTKKRRRADYEVGYVEPSAVFGSGCVESESPPSYFAYDENRYFNEMGKRARKEGVLHMYSRQKETMRQLDVEQWSMVQPLFAANGHRIRHLTIHHPMTARVALMTKCISLVSLDLILDHCERAAAPWIHRETERSVSVNVFNRSFQVERPLCFSENLEFPLEREIWAIENQFKEDVANASSDSGADDWPSYWRWEALQRLQAQWAIANDQRKDLEDLILYERRPKGIDKALSQLLDPMNPPASTDKWMDIPLSVFCKPWAEGETLPRRMNLSRICWQLVKNNRSTLKTLRFEIPASDYLCWPVDDYFDILNDNQAIWNELLSSLECLEVFEAPSIVPANSYLLSKPRRLWPSVEMLPPLRRLHLQVDVSMDELLSISSGRIRTTLSALLVTLPCRRFRRYCTCSDGQSRLDLISVLSTFPELTELELREKDHAPIDSSGLQALRTVGQHLRSLTINVPSVQDLGFVLACLPHLEQLVVPFRSNNNFYWIEDRVPIHTGPLSLKTLLIEDNSFDDLSSLIPSMLDLVKVQLPPSSCSTLLALANHCPRLRAANLQMTRPQASMIQTLLMSWPELTSLTGDIFISASSMAAQLDSSGPSWTCLQLRTLHFELVDDFQPPEQPIQTWSGTLAQLNRLTQLQDLAFHRDQCFCHRDHFPPSFIVDYGLNGSAVTFPFDLLPQLPSLKMLHTVSFAPCQLEGYENRKRGDMTAKGARWMKNNWPCLKCIWGLSNSSSIRTLMQESEPGLQLDDQWRKHGVF